LSKIPTIRIGKRTIGRGHPAYIIAEMSANHQNDFEIAKKIVYAAKEAGADAIKLQTFTADIHTLNSTKEYFRVGGGTLWDGTTLYKLYKKCEMPWEWQIKLKDLADDIGIDLFSAAVDPTSVRFLEEMGVPAHKVSSFEMVDLPLIRMMAKIKKPLIISTGMATLCEIEEAVTAARQAGCRQVALLKCTSSYPAPVEDMNLLTIPHMAECFGVPVGISDHSMGITVSVAAVALGASLVEKHFTLSRKNRGPDSAFSIEPEEFAALVQAVRDTEKALGKVQYEVTVCEKKSRIFRRSLFAVKKIKKGETLTADNVRSIRPGHGLKPKYTDAVIGSVASRDIDPGTPISWNLIRKKA
jgi:pseudaminic acid synthase